MTTPDLVDRLKAQLGTSFAIERELGGGGMSRVFLARDLTLDREVVIKVLPPGLAATVSFERFRREIMLSAALHHPNIVPVLSAGEVDGLPFFLMPYVKGESLRARLRRGPLSIRETTATLKDVARALSYAHDRGIIHRDIKPDNILLSGGAAAVVDFGVAKALTAARRPDSATNDATMTGAGVSLGTPAYMSPEQATADPSADQRSDLYSLGVVAYEMLIGVPPFYGRPHASLLAAHVHETPPAIPARRNDVPQQLTALIMRCLEKDPAARPKSAADVLRALDDTDVSTGALAAARRGPAWRLRWGVTAGAALIVLLTMLYTLLTGPAAATDSQTMAIAVTPLQSITGDQRERTIAASMTSELLTIVSQVPGMRVTSQDGSTPLDAATAPGMRLEGTVHREGDRVRVNVRLLDVQRDSTMWATARDGFADSVFALQDSVKRATAAAVNAIALDRSSQP